MAVKMTTMENGNKKVKTLYKGAVLCTREENGYDDSDFYAVCWDEAEQRCVRITYATTRFWTYENGAGVDATEEVKEKAAQWLEKWVEARHLEEQQEEARKPAKGKRVKVVKGRKVPKGTEGVVFYCQEKNYHGRWTVKVGLATSDETEAAAEFDTADNGNLLVKTPYYSQEFRNLMREMGAKWDRNGYYWIVPVEYTDEAKEAADKLFRRNTDAAWTYAQNCEVLDPEQYVDAEAAKGCAKRMRMVFELPFVKSHLLHVR